MQSQTRIFRQRVRDFMGPAPLVVPPDMGVAEVVGRMTAAKVSSIIVADADSGIGGIITEQDITRRVAFEATKGTKASQVMSAPVRTINADDHLYHAIAQMRRFGHRHMPVVDADGALAGLIGLHDAVAVAAAQTLDQIDALSHGDTIDGMKQVKAVQVSLADQLFADNLPAPEIQSLMTDINNDLYHRVVEAALADFARDGTGAPPVGFAVIVMGSGGRGENFLFPDQDNGFIVEAYPDKDHDRIDGYFTRLAVRVNEDLDKIGFPLCKGYVMAMNPLWRKTLPQWLEQLSIWHRHRDEVALRLADIFFDFKGVYGDAALVRAVRAHVTALTKGNIAFIRDMYRDDTEHRVALAGFGGLFGRFVTEKRIAAHKGEINLKHTGTLPLVESLRLFALREGIEETSSLDRIAALKDGGVLDGDEADDLRGAYTQITRFLLRQQIKDFKAGRKVSNYVSRKSLTRREKDLLYHSFKAIRAFRSRARSEFTGEVF
ncbi:MAG: putative nucleotidyltransferase substrate binding domain-containing protein [Pseudomonadota bacterium]